jgi:hypothetical protein
MRDSSKRCPRAARSALRSLRLCLTAACALSVSRSSAHPTHPGKWTDTMDWRSTAINMVLLPGDGPYQSKVLWWNHDDLGPIGGGLWGWTVPADDSVNLGTFPKSHFVDLHLGDPRLHSGQPNNIFCAGQTMLEDGRLLVTGGTALGEGGSRAVALFSANADSNGEWTSADSMHFRRWYSDNTLLPDGRVVTVTGSSFSHYAVVGGISGAGAATDSLQRFDVSFDKTWEPSVVPTSPSVALAPFSEASTAELPTSSLFLFGGREANGSIRGRAIQIQRDRDPYASDYWFKQTELTQTGTPSVPGPRIGAAVASFTLNGVTDVLMIGGSNGSLVLDEIWRGRISGNTIRWWPMVNQTSVSLPALHGASAIYADAVSQVFLFGGSNTMSETPTNLDVYSLELGAGSDSAQNAHGERHRERSPRHPKLRLADVLQESAPPRGHESLPRDALRRKHGGRHV